MFFPFFWFSQPWQSFIEQLFLVCSSSTSGGASRPGECCGPLALSLFENPFALAASFSPAPKSSGALPYGFFFSSPDRHIRFLSPRHRHLFGLDLCFC